MTDMLHKLAQMDTPAEVEVPKNLSSFAVWALVRFGGIAIATAFLAYAWNDSNESHKKQTERLITILESKARTDMELASALTDLSTAVNSVVAEAKSAHRP